MRLKKKLDGTNYIYQRKYLYTFVLYIFISYSIFYMIFYIRLENLKKKKTRRRIMRKVN